MYWHAQSGAYVIGHWTCPGFFEDLVNLGAEPRQMDEAQVGMLKAKLRPQGQAEALEDLRRRYGEEMSRMRDEEGRKGDALRWSMRRPMIARV